MSKYRKLSLILAMALALCALMPAWSEEAAPVEAIEAAPAEIEFELGETPDFIYIDEDAEADAIEAQPLEIADAELSELAAADAAETGAAFNGYAMMNVPYSVFYGDIVRAGNAGQIDAITSPTGKKAAYFRVDGCDVKGNSPASYGSGSTLSGVRLPVSMSEADYAAYAATVESQGLTAADSYYVEPMDTVPAVYAAMTDGSFTGLVADTSDLSATATLKNDQKHGDFMLVLSDDGGVLSAADKATFLVYGAVLEAEGVQYPLYHLENLYYKSFNEIAFCTRSDANQKGMTAHKDFFAGLEGKTIDRATFYTNGGVYTVNVGVKVPHFTGYALVNIPFDKFFDAIGAKLDTVDAVSAATNKVGNYGKAGGAYHSVATASIAADGTVTAVGGDNGAKLEGVTWAVKADSLSDLQALGGVEVTGDTSVTVATLGRGTPSATLLTGYAALTEAPAYAYYLLDAAPANYLTLSGGSFTANTVDAVAESAIDAPVAFGGHHSDVSVNVSAAKDIADKLVNAVALTTAKGTTALIPMYQIWSASEIGWNYADAPELNDNTVTGIRFYCSAKGGSAASAYANYVYDYPVNVYIPREFTGTLTATFEGPSAIAIDGLPADAQNVRAKVYHTTGGRNATLTYLTPLATDPADGDIDPVSAAVVNGSIAITSGTAVSGDKSVSYGQPVDGTTYTFELSSDNYILKTFTAVYTAPETLEFSGTSATRTVDLGDRFQIAVTGETIKSCKSSSKLITVTADGYVVVNAAKTGTARIAIVNSANKRRSLTLKIVDPTIPTKVTLAEGKTATVYLGTDFPLTAVVEPATADKAVTFKPSNKRVTVSADGVVTPVSTGKCTVTVRTSNGKTARITLTVVDPKIPTKLTLAEGKAATVYLGTDFPLTAVVEPATADKTVTFKPGNKRVTVSADGVVTPVSTGKCTVTAKTSNGKTAKITLTVVDPKIPTGVTIDQGKTATLPVGGTLKLSATVAPATADKAVTWSASNQRVTVSANGTVTAVKAGTVTVTARTSNGKKTSIKLTVTKP